MKEHSNLRRKYFLAERTDRLFSDEDMDRLREIDKELIEKYPAWTQNSQPSQDPDENS